MSLHVSPAWTWTAPSLSAVLAFTLKTKGIRSAAVKYFIATFAGSCYSATATVKSLRWEREGGVGGRERERERYFNSLGVLCSHGATHKTLRHVSRDFLKAQYLFFQANLPK